MDKLVKILLEPLLPDRCGCADQLSVLVTKCPRLTAGGGKTGSQFKWLQSTVPRFHCFWPCGEVSLMVQGGWRGAALFLVAGKEGEILMRGRDMEP